MKASVKNILRHDIEIKINGSLWFESGGNRFLGPGPIELLERIGETGSISSAAKEMKMSYKKAWDLINHLNAYTANPVVIPQVGGEKGGGSVLSAEAFELIEYHRNLRQRFAAFLEAETKNLKV